MLSRPGRLVTEQCLLEIPRPCGSHSLIICAIITTQQWIHARLASTCSCACHLYVGRCLWSTATVAMATATNLHVYDPDRCTLLHDVASHSPATLTSVSFLSRLSGSLSRSTAAALHSHVGRSFLLFIYSRLSSCSRVLCALCPKRRRRSSSHMGRQLSHFSLLNACFTRMSLCCRR